MTSSSPKPSPSPDRKYGMLLREKTLPKVNAIVVSVPALAFAFVALTAGPISLMSVGVLLMAVGLLALAAWTFSYRARIYDNGVTVESLFGKRGFSFRDLHTFGYARVLQGGQQRDSLTFLPRTGKPLRIVMVPDLRTGGDADLARLAEQLTPKISSRMEQELNRTRRVQWVNRVTGTVPPQPAVALTRDAYLLEENGGTVTIPFVAVETAVSNGLFIVSDLGTGKRRFAIPCLSANFYPGLALQQRLLQPAPPAPAPVGP